MQSMFQAIDRMNCASIKPMMARAGIRPGRPQMMEPLAGCPSASSEHAYLVRKPSDSPLVDDSVAQSWTGQLTAAGEARPWKPFVSHLGHHQGLGSWVRMVRD